MFIHNFELISYAVHLLLPL